MEYKIKSYDHIYRYGKQSKIRSWFIFTMIFMGLILFLPWTQNIKTNGVVTSLYQDQRPQLINSPIPGRIVKWYVKEGDYVKKGDTLLQLTEVKDDYLDPQLIAKTQNQLDAKKIAIDNYQFKINTADNQIKALKAGRTLKIEQLKNKLSQLDNKLQGETAEMTAIKNEAELAKDQYDRQLKMYDEGLVTKTQLQQRNISYQNALAKMVSIENKIAQTKQEITNTKIEQNGVDQEYAEKINKIEGEQFQSQSQIAIGQGEIAKLENQVSNYIIRNGMYHMLAPQDGQVVQSKRSGIGEIIKDGETIMSVVPNKADYAVEMFVRPVDLPLINIGQKVRFMFDGFPAIVFSGWPENSYGTFGGSIVAFENSISLNGMFRILVAEDNIDKPWPSSLKIGCGTRGICLLKDVPVWYELWRNINGFPPDFYQIKEDGKSSSIEKSK
jgi:multidrug resistance efflux pump